MQKLQGQKPEKYCFYQNVLRDSKKSKFIKQQEAIELFSSLRIKASLVKVPLVGPVFF